MNNLYAIFRYSNGQRSIVYNTSDNLYQNQSLLLFIDIFISELPQHTSPVKKCLSTNHQFYQVHFIPEEAPDSDRLQILVVVQLTEKLDASLKDQRFLDSIRLFFHKGTHDMKNLLNNMQLLFKENMISQAQHYLDELKTHYLPQIEAFYEALNQLIDIEKPAEPVVETIYFAPLVDYIRQHYPMPDHLSVNIETNFTQCPAITYRHDYLTSMVVALFDNAIRYRVADKALIIKIRTKETKEYTIFTIQDNGEGVDLSRYGHKIFEPFQRFSQQSVGQGLGLHLVKIAVEKNGGKITLDSNSQQGITATLFLKKYV